jgi:hypothetical protein
MIQGVTDPDRFIYHYTTAGAAKDCILKNGTLRLGSVRKMNDPKESKSWEFNVGTNKNCDLLKYKQPELSERFSQVFKDNTRILCFCRDASPLSGDHIREIAQRGFAKPRMWAQYAALHSGVCLVFDRKRLTERVSAACSEALFAYYGNVTYRNRMVISDFDEPEYMINADRLESDGFDSYWKLHLNQFRGRLLFEKMEDWRDEREFRFVAVYEAPQDVYVTYEDSLVGVVFGELTDRTHEDEMMQLLDGRNVEFMGLKWKNCSPWYDFGNLRYSKGFRPTKAKA